MAEAQDVDVQQVMDRIRENIRRRRSLEPGPASEPVASGSHDGGGVPDVARLQAIGDLRKISLSSHRQLLGRFVVAVKTILFKLLTPILERQTTYNAASARAVAGIATAMQTLERRQAHVLEAAIEQVSERSRGQVAELRAALNEELARVTGELIARMAQEARAREKVNGTALQLRDEVRQELAAQRPAIESARQANAAMRERLSASERRWRRVLHVLQPEGPAGGPAQTRLPEETPTRAPSELEPVFDYAGFEERFRGSEEDIKDRQRMYVPYFRGARNVVDLGCGRGEFLELLRDEKIEARGLDLDLDMVLLCRDKELDVVRADAFTYLDALADDTVGGIFAAQLIEHFPPRRIIDLVKLCHRKLAPGGFLVLETPNPGCLMVFADSFYRDLSHFQPIHSDTLKFLFEAAGFDAVETRFSAPVDPAVKIPPLQLPGADVERLNQGIERLNSLLFGFQDYAVIGSKIA